MNFKLNITILFMAILILISCAESKLYTNNDTNSGPFILSNADSIRNYLSLISGEKMKDTIIVKYDFNYETCWSLLDEQSDKYIAGIIDSTNDYISKYKKAHPNVTVLQIREQGRSFNKLVLRNKQFIVDKGYLRKNIFNKKATCGTSMKLYPDGSCKLIFSDSHFTILK